MLIEVTVAVLPAVTMIVGRRVRSHSPLYPELPIRLKCNLSRVDSEVLFRRRPRCILMPVGSPFGGPDGPMTGKKGVW